MFRQPDGNQYLAFRFFYISVQFPNTYMYAHAFQFLDAI